MTGDSGIDLNRVRAFLAGKRRRRQEHLRRRWQEANRDFERISGHIIAVYNPLRVYQWGSLLNLRTFSEISDIDIALEGLTGPEQFFAILGDAMRMTEFPLDIIEIDKIDIETAELIRTRGRLVYERRQR